MKKMWGVIVLCFFITACNSTNQTDSNIQMEEENLKASKIFYDIEDKIANNNEFDKGSKIEEIIISNESIENLALLGKIWGYIKYYHPNVAEGKYNWDYELFRVMPEILGTENITERNRVLLDWIESQGEVKIVNGTKLRSSKTKIIPNLEWIMNPDLGEELSLQLTNIRDAERTEKNYYVSLYNGVGNPIFKNELSYLNMKYPDTGYRLLSLYRYWNIIEYYFPYKYLIEENWDDVLIEFIPKFIEAESELEYKLAVLELVVRVHDTHAIIYNDSTLERHWGKNYAPVRVEFIEEKAVVTGYYNNTLGKESELKVGDIITKVNNKTVEDIIKDKLKYTPASNYIRQLAHIARDILRTNDEYLSVEYIRDGKGGKVEVECSLIGGATINIIKPQDTYFKFINPNIAYIYPGLINNKYIPDIMSEIKDTKGLIIDLRCYPSDFMVYTLGEYLLPQSTEFVKITEGSILEPGLFEETVTLKVGKENPNYYKGKVIIIINETTLSQAEFTTMAFRTSPNATVIGNTTAAADGNISTFSLPGGINTVITGIGIYYPDGTETQRVGILPDIEIRPNIEGIKEGRDELLEKAIEIIGD